MPSAAVPSTATLEALTKLSEDPKNLVYIISGRDGGFLEQHLGHLDQVGFSAEHGCFVREPGTKQWKNLTESLDMSWMPEVEELFEYYTEVRCIPISNLPHFDEVHLENYRKLYRNEEKLYYMALPGKRPNLGVSWLGLVGYIDLQISRSFQCKQCLDLLENNLVPKRPIEGLWRLLVIDLLLTIHLVLVGKKNLEVRPIAINKGEIVKRILYNNPDAEFVFCAGDDKVFFLHKYCRLASF